MSKLESRLYEVLEARLKKSKRPLTAPELYDEPEIFELAGSCNRVSDYLANLWRKGRATRTNAPPMVGSAARFAYSHKARKDVGQLPMGQVALPANGAVTVGSMTVTEQRDSVLIEVGGLSITVKKL